MSGFGGRKRNEVSKKGTSEKEQAGAKRKKVQPQGLKERQKDL
jgi:hypothetical protein